MVVEFTTSRNEANNPSGWVISYLSPFHQTFHPYFNLKRPHQSDKTKSLGGLGLGPLPDFER
jgi:hypothetical protein